MVRISNENSSTVYRYDPAGRVQASMQSTNSQDYPFVYTYNGIGLTSVQYPSSRVIRYSYDNAGRVNTAANGVGTDTYASGIEYAPHGETKSLLLGTNLRQTTTFTSLLQPETIEASSISPSSSIFRLTLGYPASGNNGNVMQQTVVRPELTVTAELYVLPPESTGVRTGGFAMERKL